MTNILNLRSWCNSDCRMIYDWRMDPSVRMRSLNHEEFPYSEHEQWFRRFLSNSQSFGYILEKNGEPVAQIRFDKTMNEGYYNISVSTAPRKTGMGYGNAILELSCKRKELLELARFLVAEVFEDNIPSRKIFEKNGFRQTGKAVINGQSVLLYKREL